MKSLWCSAHSMTPDQEWGKNIFMLKDVNPGLHEKLLNCPSDKEELMNLAISLLEYAKKNEISYILQPAGSLAFQFRLGICAPDYPVTIVYAHSERQSVDVDNGDGTVTKTSVFKHVAWV